jgi:hypothetical protein
MDIYATYTRHVESYSNTVQSLSTCSKRTASEHDSTNTNTILQAASEAALAAQRQAQEEAERAALAAIEQERIKAEMALAEEKKKAEEERLVRGRKLHG